MAIKQGFFNRLKTWYQNEGPPDLEKMIKDFLKTFSSNGGKNNNNYNKNSNKSNFKGFDVTSPSMEKFIIWGVMAVIGAYIVAGFYVVQPAEKAVITRFGKYVKTQDSGLHWLPYFIERKAIINVEGEHSIKRSSKMLTQDGNILDVELVMQYHISDGKDFLFNVADQVQTLEQIMDSALRDAVGNSTLDLVMTNGRADIVIKIKSLIKDIVANYKLGIYISNVALQTVETPVEVRDAFSDAIKAKSDEDAYKNQAIQYAKKVIPVAEGKASRLFQEAAAYKAEKIVLAQGEAARFESLLPEYRMAPEVVRARLYLRTMEKVLSSTSKILVDVEGAGNMIYLPIEQILKAKADAEQLIANNVAVEQFSPGVTSTRRYNDSSNDRRN